MGFDNRNGVRVITLFCCCTCIFVSLILVYLIYTDNLYNIGKYRSIVVLIAFAFVESLKLGWCLKYNNDGYLSLVSKDFKSSSSKGIKRYYYGRTKLKEVFKSATIMVVMTFVFFSCAIFFGASFVSHHEETLMLAALITTLSVFPGCIHLGADVTVSLLAGMRPLPGDLLTEMIQRNIQCTVFGAWFGAIVVPLDWNRPWQKWPIPCSFGAIGGYTIAHLITFVTLMPVITKLFSRKQFLV